MALKIEIEKSYEEQNTKIKLKVGSTSRDKRKEISINKSFVIIITGVRRAGKSTLMAQLMEETASGFAYFNFEDPRIFDFETKDFIKLDEIIGDKSQFYFFDEIQNVDKWELYIRKLHDQEKSICITGSNASLLSKELGTRLTGRHIQVELFPFSYNEYLNFKKQIANEPTFKSYLNEGGFPEYLKTGKEEALQQLFKDIVYRDIVVRYGIRNHHTFISIALFLISNVGKEFSYTNIKNIFKVGSVNSVLEYVSWLEDSYLIFTVPRFSYSLKVVTINPKKIYVIDTGFGKANSLSFSEDRGRVLENAVFLQLRRKYSQIYYFKEKGECDFVIKEKDKVTQAYQVSEQINSENSEREVDGLLAAMAFFNLEKGIIITQNQEDNLTFNEKMIQLIPAWKWFAGI